MISFKTPSLVKKMKQIGQGTWKLGKCLVFEKREEKNAEEKKNHLNKIQRIVRLLGSYEASPSWLQKKHFACIIHTRFPTGF